VHRFGSVVRSVPRRSPASRGGNLSRVRERPDRRAARFDPTRRRASAVRERLGAGTHHRARARRPTAKLLRDRALPHPAKGAAPPKAGLPGSALLDGAEFFADLDEGVDGVFDVGGFSSRIRQNALYAGKAFTQPRDHLVQMCAPSRRPLATDFEFVPPDHHADHTTWHESLFDVVFGYTIAAAAQSLFSSSQGSVIASIGVVAVVSCLWWVYVLHVFLAERAGCRDGFFVVMSLLLCGPLILVSLALGNGAAAIGVNWTAALVPALWVICVLKLVQVIAWFCVAGGKHRVDPDKKSPQRWGLPTISRAFLASWGANVLSVYAAVAYVIEGRNEYQWAALVGVLLGGIARMAALRSARSMMDEVRENCSIIPAARVIASKRRPPDFALTVWLPVSVVSRVILVLAVMSIRWSGLTDATEVLLCFTALIFATCLELPEPFRVIVDGRDISGLREARIRERFMVLSAVVFAEVAETVINQTFPSSSTLALRTACQHTAIAALIAVAVLIFYLSTHGRQLIIRPREPELTAPTARERQHPLLRCLGRAIPFGANLEAWKGAQLLALSSFCVLVFAAVEVMKPPTNGAAAQGSGSDAALLVALVAAVLFSASIAGARLLTTPPPNDEDKTATNDQDTDRGQHGAPTELVMFLGGTLIFWAILAVMSTLLR
jgi:uncharacterized membrane protein YkvI